MERQIVCLSIPRVEVALARLENPSLRSRPLAIASMPAARATVRETSFEAEEAGVSPGLSVARARQRCPSLAVIPSKPSQVEQVQRALFSTITPVAPLWEAVRPGQVFLDLTGTSRLFGTACETAMRVKRDLTQRTGLWTVAGIGTNKLVAHMATTVLTPPQLCDIRPGSEQIFLRPLPLSSFPGLRGPEGSVLRGILKDLNLHAVRDIADVSVEALKFVFGRWALPLYRWARGIDPSPVFPPDHAPIVIQSHVFEPDTLEEPHLVGGLSSLTEMLCSVLRGRQQVCGRLALTLSYSDHSIIHRSMSLATSTQWEVEMFPFVRTLFQRCFFRRVRVRSLTIRANGFRLPPEQLSLFDVDSRSDIQKQPRAHRLAIAVDRLRTRFGMQTIRWGRSGPPEFKSKN